MDRFQYIVPKSLEEASALLATGGVAKAGGMDLLDRMKERVTRPEKVVSLAAGRGDGPPITAGDAGARISAFATLAEVAGHADLAKLYPSVAHAAAEAATPNVRNVATAAGNLLQEPRCWYYRLAEFDCRRKGGDSCPAMNGENQFHAIIGYGDCPAVHASNLAPPLLALSAAVEIAGKPPRRIEELWLETTSTAKPSPDGPDRPRAGRGASMFHTLAAGELVKAIVLPPPTPNAYVEIRHKQSFDWALASAAVAQAADGSWRIVLGGVAPAPWRATDAEKALGREPLNENRIRAAAEAAVARAKPLSGNAYKVRLAKVAVGRALRKAAGGDK